MEKINKEIGREIVASIKKAKGWSFSAANGDSRCDLKRVFDKLFSNKKLEGFFDHIPYRDGELPLVVGSASHQFMDDYTNHCYSKGVEKDPEEGQKIIGRISAEMEIPAEMDAIFTELCTSIIKYREFNLSLNMHAELELALKISDGELVKCEWGDKDAVVRSKIDQVVWVSKYDDGPIVIDDYKTNWQQFGAEDEEAIKQLKFYAVLLDIYYPEWNMSERDITLSWDFLRLGRKTTIENFDLKTERVKIISEISTYIKMMNRKVQNFNKDAKQILGMERGAFVEFISNYFKPTINKYCSCKYFNICPTYIKAMASTDLPDDLSNVKNKKEGDKKNSEAHVKHLKACFKNGGPVDVGDFFYGQYRKTGVSYSPEIFFQLIKEEMLSDRSDKKEFIEKVFDGLKELGFNGKIASSLAEKEKLLSGFLKGSEELKETKKWDWVKNKDHDSTDWC